MADLFEAALVNALAEHVIPKLPDVTQIPDSSWQGWDPVFRELQVDRSNAQQVHETISRCQATLTNLLQAAMLNGAQHQVVLDQLGEHQVLVPGGDLQQHQHHSLPPDNGAPASMPPSQPLHLTQLLGSEADQQVLLQQPNVHIISRAKMPRGDRLEVWYQLSFEGYPESEAEWFPAARIRSEHPHGEQLIAAFDRGLEASGQGDVALPPHAEERAAALSFGTTPQGNDVTTIVGSKRGRDVDSHDPSKRPRSDGEAATTVAPVKENQHMDPALGVATDAAAAAAAAAAASASAGFAGQLSAGGQVFAIPGADGQSMLQVVPLQLPAQIDASGLGQIDLSQLDPTTLQALNLQAVNVNDMQQLVLHMPGQDLASQLQLAGVPGMHLTAMGGLQASHGPRPSREAVVAHLKEALKLLMHASEELQRKRRQQNRRTELNQRRAMVLPDGSAAPGALPTYSGGSMPPSLPLRPNNMLAAIQNMPPQEKRAMLVSALRRALPVMMQAAQPKHMRGDGYESYRDGGMMRTSSDAADGYGSDDPNLAVQLQYQQLLAQQGGAGMQLIAVPLQGGVQGLVQMPLTAEQLQAMGLPPGSAAPIALDASMLQGIPAVMDPASMGLAGISMLTPEQLQAVGIDPTMAAALGGQATTVALTHPEAALDGSAAAAAAGVLDPTVAAAMAAAAAAANSIPQMHDHTRVVHSEVAAAARDAAGDAAVAGATAGMEGMQAPGSDALMAAIGLAQLGHEGGHDRMDGSMEQQHQVAPPSHAEGLGMHTVSAAEQYMLPMPGMQ